MSVLVCSERARRAESLTPLSPRRPCNTPWSIPIRRTSVRGDAGTGDGAMSAPAGQPQSGPGPVRGPVYSPDGHYWWNGRAWVLTANPPLTPEPSGKHAEQRRVQSRMALTYTGTRRRWPCEALLVAPEHAGYTKATEADAHLAAELDPGGAPSVLRRPTVTDRMCCRFFVVVAARIRDGRRGSVLPRIPASGSPSWPNC